jgi:hypothetical protein
VAARAIWYSVLFLIVVARPAAAQDTPKVGVTMAYPGAVGVVRYITEGIAVRPDFSIARGSSESVTANTSAFPGSSATTTSTAESWAATVGLSVLVYLKTTDPVRFYLAPRLAYTRSTNEGEFRSAGVLAGSSTSDGKATGFIAAGSFGAQYGPHERFAVFGELGLQYSNVTSKSTSGNSRNEFDSTTVGLRSAVGVTVYF